MVCDNRIHTYEAVVSYEIKTILFSFHGREGQNFR